MLRAPMLAVLLAGSMLLFGTAGASEAGQQARYYKWRDAHGTVHVTAEPPPGRAATELKMPAATTVSSPAPGQTAPPENAGPSPEVLQAREDYRRRACSSARDEMLRLDEEASSHSQAAGDAAARFAAEQRAQAKLRARQRMLQYCGR